MLERNFILYYILSLINIHHNIFKVSINKSFKFHNSNISA